MKIICGDLWRYGDWKVIPTNLSINKDGLAVMGKGVAKQASLKYGNLPRAYAKYLKIIPQPSLYLYPLGKLICLPVKRKWRDQANLSLIEEGVRALAKQGDGIDGIALPLIGCGFGELDALDVLPILAHHLTDNRFVLILRDKEATQRHAATLKPGARRARGVWHPEIPDKKAALQIQSEGENKTA